MADSIRVAMLGASGRMGRSIIPLIAGDANGCGSAARWSRA